MGSTRLPGKVLLPIAGRPMLEHVVERAGRIVGCEEVAVAIPDLPQDDLLADAVRAMGRPVIRGPSTDVLARYVAAIRETRADAVVRLTADCPLLSPEVSSAIVHAFVAGAAHYASNTLQRTYPRGLDTEVVAAEALSAAARESTEAWEREHVTPFIWRQPERFVLRSVRGATDDSDLRWTVDTPEDLAVVRGIYEEAESDRVDLGEALDIVRRRRPDLRRNARVPQKAIGDKGDPM